MVVSREGKWEISRYHPESTKTSNFNPRRTLSGSFFVIPECLVKIHAVVLAMIANKLTKNTLNYQTLCRDGYINTVGQSTAFIYNLSGIFTSAFSALVNKSPRVVYIGYRPPYRTIYIIVHKYIQNNRSPYMVSKMGSCTAHKDIHSSSLHATETKVILLELKSNTHSICGVQKTSPYVLLCVCTGSMQQAKANVQLTAQAVLPSPSQKLHVPK